MKNDMAPEFTTMAWNVLDGFSDAQRAQGIIDTVTQERPDAVVFSEAWREGQDTYLDDVLGEFDAGGYAVAYGLYDDSDGRLDRHGIMGIVRHELTDTEPDLITGFGRSALHMTLALDETIVDIFGIHGDDRSAATRATRMDAFLDFAKFAKGPAVVAGDLNDMHVSDPLARTLRTMQPVVRHLPTIEPRPDFKPPKLKRFGSLARRLTEMAAGTSLVRLEAAGFQDTDPLHQATKGPFNLDHIYSRGLTVLEQRTYEKTRLSDHRAISTRFHV